MKLNGVARFALSSSLVVAYITSYIWLSRRSSADQVTYELDGIFLVSSEPKHEQMETALRFVFWPLNTIDQYVFGGDGYAAYPTFHVADRREGQQRSNIENSGVTGLFDVVVLAEL